VGARQLDGGRPVRLELNVDGASHYVDSTDPDLLGRWIVEILARGVPYHPASYITVQAYPSFLPANPETGRSRGPDWIGGGHRREVTDRTPRGVLAALAATLDQLEQTTGEETP
jgi:hypothetical protein